VDDDAPLEYDEGSDSDEDEVDVVQNNIPSTTSHTTRRYSNRKASSSNYVYLIQSKKMHIKNHKWIYTEEEMAKIQAILAAEADPELKKLRDFYRRDREQALAKELEEQEEEAFRSVHYPEKISRQLPLSGKQFTTSIKLHKTKIFAQWRRPRLLVFESLQ
jgi:hypothetical protein